MSISNLSRLYLINTNLKVVKDNIEQYNLFDHVGFAEEITVLENMIIRMREVLDDIREETK